ncbi:MAG: hypothetical protein M1376_10895 [Planctomycetes bacterium]|nr:hypothetical protein [Planctomycetota bacterium]
MRTFPNFGVELRRDFELHENCCDCPKFYGPDHGAMRCQGWHASRDFTCRDFNRLPDVMPGTCGQVFPLSRRRTPAHPEPIKQDQPENGRQAGPEPDPATPPALDTPREDLPVTGPREPASPRTRTCACGAALPKGKRLCDACRTQNRRRTMRQYIRSYREQQSPAAVRSDQDMPLPAQQPHAT